MQRQERRERLEPELEAVGLVLVAPEEQDRPVLGGLLRRREVPDVDGVVQDLPRSGRLGDELVRRALAELALVEDMLGRAEHSTERSVEPVRAAPCPARIADAVLVEQERYATPPYVPEQRSEIARQPRRAEIQEREVGRLVGEAGGQPLELRRAPGDGLTRRGDLIVAVEHAHSRSGLTAGEQLRPTPCGAHIAQEPSSTSVHRLARVDRRARREARPRRRREGRSRSALQPRVPRA